MEGWEGWRRLEGLINKFLESRGKTDCFELHIYQCINLSDRAAARLQPTITMSLKPTALLKRHPMNYETTRRRPFQTYLSHTIQGPLSTK